jgi:hypothetical protein
MPGGGEGPFEKKLDRPHAVPAFSRNDERAADQQKGQEGEDGPQVRLVSPVPGAQRSRGFRRPTRRKGGSAFVFFAGRSRRGPRERPGAVMNSIRVELKKRSKKTKPDFGLVGRASP